MLNFIYNKKNEKTKNNKDSIPIDTIELVDVVETRVNDIENNSTDTMSIETKDSNSSRSEFLFNKTRENIKKRLNKTIEFDIADTIRWRFIYRKGGNLTEGLALVTSLISTVLSFSAGAFNHTYLAFAAGCLGSVSLALMRATSWSHKESKEREEQLNILLDKAHIKDVPSLIQEEET